MSPARIVTNPANGELLTWLDASRAELRVYGAGRGERDPQVCAQADKRFTVLRGRMAILVDGRVTVVEEGGTIAVPAGSEHAWWSTRAGELCLHVEGVSERACHPIAA
jgi:mannose-6-phosphate isomerase-like protein (cupin superfamily)